MNLITYWLKGREHIECGGAKKKWVIYVLDRMEQDCGIVGMETTESKTMDKEGLLYYKGKEGYYVKYVEQ